MPNDMVNDREEERNGHGNNEEGDTTGINPSHIIGWQGSRTLGIFARWHFGSPGSMIRIIGPLLRSFERGRLVSSSATARAAKLSPCNSQLPPMGEQDAQTRLVGELWATCEEDAPMQHKCCNWISEESWLLIAHRAMLRCTGCLCQAGGRCMQHQIGALLRKDRAGRTEQVGTLIESKLTGGNVQEAFRPHRKRRQSRASKLWSARLWREPIYTRGGCCRTTLSQSMLKGSK